MSGSLSVPARAKVNLTLHVTGRRADGYHLLDSLVVFAELGDRLVLKPAAVTSLEIDGPFGAALQDNGGENLVVSAHKALLETFPDKVLPTAFTLTKNLPVASGIGGGSANAAAALTGLVELYGLSVVDLDNLALGLGADVPVCLGSRSARMSGIGETIDRVSAVPCFDAVLVNPNVGVSTAAVFKSMGLAVGETINSAMTAPPTSDQSVNGWIDWLSQMRNDLEAPAIEISPSIADVLAALGATQGCLFARMSGSGATCFGLYENQQAALAAAKDIAARHPGWWVEATRFNAPATSRA